VNDGALEFVFFRHFFWHTLDQLNDHEPPSAVLSAGFSISLMVPSVALASGLFRTSGMGVRHFATRLLPSSRSTIFRVFSCFFFAEAFSPIPEGG